MSKAIHINEFSKTTSAHEGANTLARFFTGLPLGVCITACLLWMMQALVNNEHPLEMVDDAVVIPDVFISGPPKVHTQIEEPPVRPVEVQQPPKVTLFEPIEIDPGSTSPGFGGPIVIEKPPIAAGIGATGQMIPFIKVPPQYPQSALAKGVEGYVDVMFDVTELGTTDNIRVIGFQPSSVFNRSVLKAIKNWKYKPNVVDGVPVRTPDVRDRVTFKLEK